MDSRQDSFQPQETLDKCHESASCAAPRNRPQQSPPTPQMDGECERAGEARGNDGGEIAVRDAEIARHLERIERMAEERHLLHGSIKDSFWNCSRACCREVAKYLRESPKHFDCAARRAGTAGGNDPAECDWPFCGCDPAATRVLGAIQDAGLVIVRDAKP